MRKEGVVRIYIIWRGMLCLMRMFVTFVTWLRTVKPRTGAGLKAMFVNLFVQSFPLAKMIDSFWQEEGKCLVKLIFFCWWAFWGGKEGNFTIPRPFLNIPLTLI